MSKPLRCILVLFFFTTILIPAKGQAALFVLIFGDKVASENFHYYRFGI